MLVKKNVKAFAGIFKRSSNPETTASRSEDTQHQLGPLFFWRIQ
jgi:hypothetical protein